ncbi:ABC transporter ATP-binding protein [Castellaniella sp.]|uniref:ABC transporter ATP-binding protein n=1 Tax=Castellaniella sp. TaxID=1955812 RepID=UPI00355EB77F
MIAIEHLNVSIQQVPILRDVTLSVPKGQMVGLIGRNGAGKTTLLRTTMGVIRPDSGKIIIGGVQATHLEGYWRARNQIGYMPEDRRLVPDLNVEENILLPTWATRQPDTARRLAWIYELMPEVAGFSPRLALSLSGGQQKLVALARALMVGQKLLLLDEPFEGVAPMLAMRLVEVIKALKAQGLSVLIAESDYTYTSGVVDLSYVIERGSVTTQTH